MDDLARNSGSEPIVLKKIPPPKKHAQISKEQRSGEWPVWETSLVNPSFAAFARLCGAHGAKVAKGAHVETALSEALAINGSALVEIMTDAELV